MAIHRNHIQKCFKREIETSQIMNIQSGFYSQIGNLSAVPMRQTAHLSKHSRLSISTLISHTAKNVSILKHPAFLHMTNAPVIGLDAGKTSDDCALRRESCQAVSLNKVSSLDRAL
ncbi:hypothetical protein PQR37_32920 [Paraburkholderia nemoris]|uniref:hypothetical protein n=1 Tax=Paraburkholderia nemoris TaxID=2793076 RepID=UPI000FFBAE40|nr:MULTISPECIES: hypothetical protein [Paraburkholderia]MBK3784701.1 hypothetical protein [Paraburkholderia aspalathi]MBK5146698.1 hypothetical protein [Burkholderia sp. R-69608]